MRYLVLLLLLIGCNSEPKYKVGDCVHIVHNAGVVDIRIKEITKNYYVFKGIYNNGVGLVEVDTLLSFTFNELENGTDSKRIDCSEVD